MPTTPDMPNEQNQKPLLGADNNALVALLAINLVVYVILGLIKIVYYLESLPLEQFYTQIFNPFTITNHWLNNPWSLLTYNWVHDGFWILFANMIWLTLFSYTLQINDANKHLFPIYFYSGILGGFAFLIFGSSNTLIGAGVCVTSLVVAAMTLIPNHKYFKQLMGGLPLWIVGIIYLLLNGYQLIGSSMAVILANVIGGCTGLFYVIFLKKGVDLGKWMHQLLHLLNNSLAPKN